MAVEAYINPGVLRWARERAGLTTEEAGHRLDVRADRLEAWETGASRPTFRQAQEIARRLNIPFGYLFLSAPPEEKVPLPDLRTVGDEPSQRPSPELLDTVSDALAKQEWYRDFLLAEGAARPPFVGRYSLQDNYQVIAADIRQTLGIDESLRRKAISWENFLGLLVAQVEKSGVLVLRNGVVGHNTSRQLSVQEFRGFAISDEVAPLIFVNARDAKSAQIFTLAHELAHLWIGKSGISNPDYRQASNQPSSPIERMCNRIAAETLLPNADLTSHWSAAEPIEANLQAVAKVFRVSALVVLRQAYDCKLIETAEFWATYDRLLQRQRAEEPKGEGGDFYRTLFIRSSRNFTIALSEALAEERVTYLEAARLLNVKLDTLDRISAHLSEMSA